MSGKDVTTYCMNPYQGLILEFLKKSFHIDFSGYNPRMVERRIDKRVFATKTQNFENYLMLLKSDPKELDNFLDALTINVSRFFRDTLVFEYFGDIILPLLMGKKKRKDKTPLRIWSAGCSFGEEAYSVAILLNEAKKKEKQAVEVEIFATDIDKKAIKKAQQALFPFDSIKTVKYGLLLKYFKERNGQFELLPEIRDMVNFSYFDLLDGFHIFPPEFVYASFDLILCRNVLIYVNPDNQETIFHKLFQSLESGGYLFLGQAETPSQSFKSKFKIVQDPFHIFQKR